MGKFISGFAVVAALLLSNASAALTIKQTRDMFNQGGQDRELLTLYLNGYMSGFNWANVRLDAEGRAELYCPPEGFAINAENIYRMTDNYIKTQDKEVGSGWPFDLFISKALMNTFPCD
jgi:hypothetical protein